MGSRLNGDLVREVTAVVSEVIKLRDFCNANIRCAREAAKKAGNLAGHGYHTGEAAAFEAMAGYCEMSLAKLGFGRIEEQQKLTEE